MLPLVMLVIQPLHHVVQAVPVLRGATDLDVEQQADQRGAFALPNA